jgi:legumain
MFNKPTAAGVKGKDVYAGCKIDYKGEAVTPENFVAILEGKKTTGGNGKTLKSTSEDHVFINFADHGGVGLIAFPSSYLYADDLIKALKTMHTKNMYK